MDLITHPLGLRWCNFGQHNSNPGDFVNACGVELLSCRTCLARRNEQLRARRRVTVEDADDEDDHLDGDTEEEGTGVINGSS